MLTAMKNQIAKIEEKLVKLIKDSPEYQAKNTILQSVPGIGNIAAASIISNVPELGYISNKQAASLIGVAQKVVDTKASELFKEGKLKYVRSYIWQ